MNISAFLLTNLLNGFLAIALMVGGYFLFDACTRWSFKSALASDRITGGSIVVAAFLLSLGLVIAAAAM